LGLCQSTPRFITCKTRGNYKWRGRKPPSRPSTFSVNRESREEAKNTYLQLFSPSFDHAIDLNSISDTLFLTCPDLESYLFPSPLRSGRSPYMKFDADQRLGFRSLALSFDVLLGQSWILDILSHIYRGELKALSETIRSFPNVTDVFIVHFNPDDHPKNLQDKVVHAVTERLRLDQLECCTTHEPHCNCRFKAFPKINCMLSFDRLKDNLRAEEVRIDGRRISSPCLESKQCS
jgi:hypothetical protein